MWKHLLISSLIIISINAWGMASSLVDISQRKDYVLSSVEIISNEVLLNDLTKLFSRYEINAKDIKDRICESKIDLSIMPSDQYFFDLYLQRLQKLVEYEISSDQIELLKDFFINNEDKNPSYDRRNELKKEYNKKKSILIQKWEYKYARKWPTYNVEEGGILEIKPMTAHHIILRESGGVNEWWNIAPLSAGQHMMIHQCSAEERACFSQDSVEREFFRIFLKIKTLYPTTESYESGRTTLEKAISKASREVIYNIQHSKPSDQNVEISKNIDHQKEEVIGFFVQVIINNDKENIRKIKKQKMYINAKDKNGDTLLVLAVKNKRKTIVKKLLKYGADLSIKSYDGKTPLQIAEEKGYKRIAEILQEYGNKTIGQNVCETENISANKETVKVL